MLCLYIIHTGQRRFILHKTVYALKKKKEKFYMITLSEPCVLGE